MTEQPTTPPFDTGATSAFARHKSRFLSRNFERCGYLRVDIRQAPTGDRLVFAASFTLDAVRRWHRVESALNLPLSDDVEEAFAALFERLEDGIGTARIAQLFAPLGAAGRPASDGG
ncbi:MAG: hypothetical protein IPK28_06260 [Devosia sp.]|nr:hypothetical protein [Devosia sp.]